MDDLVRWLGEQLDTDAEAARAADVKEGDPAWWVSPVLADGDSYTVRSERDNAPIARVRRLYDDDGHTVVLDGRAVAEHIAAHDPARVLREIDAKRQLVKLHGRATLRAGGGAQYFDTTTVCRSCEPSYQVPELSWPCPTLRLLALPYADRPGYREEWRP